MQLAAAMGRLGTESAFEVLARATRLQQEGRSIINLGIGQPDFPTPPHIVEAAVKALRDGHHGYTPANGILPLREAVAADMALRRGFEVHPDRIVIVPGGKVTMFMAIAMFGEPGAEIMYPDPGFPIYRSLIEWTGAAAVPMALHESRGFAFSADEVLAQITPRTRLMIVNSPANPTGGVVPQGRARPAGGGPRRAIPQVAVLSDEIYARMCYDGVPHASLTAYPEIEDRLILLDGWSKTYAMTGWRLGWGVWPASLVEHATRLAINTHSCVNAAAQWAGIAALTGPQDAVDAHGRDLRRAAARSSSTALNDAPGLPLRHAGRRLLRLPQHRGHRPELARAAGGAADRGRRRRRSAAPASASSARAIVRFSYAASSEAIEEACAASGAICGAERRRATPRHRGFHRICRRTDLASIARSGCRTASEARTMSGAAVTARSVPGHLNLAYAAVVVGLGRCRAARRAHGRWRTAIGRPPGWSRRSCSRRCRTGRWSTRRCTAISITGGRSTRRPGGLLSILFLAPFDGLRFGHLSHHALNARPERAAGVLRPAPALAVCGRPPPIYFRLLLRHLSARGRERAAEPAAAPACCARSCAGCSTTAPRTPPTWPTGPSGCSWRPRRCAGCASTRCAILRCSQRACLALRRGLAAAAGRTARPGLRRLGHGQRAALWRRAGRPRPGLRPAAAAGAGPVWCSTPTCTAPITGTRTCPGPRCRTRSRATAGTMPAATCLRRGGSCAARCRSRQKLSARAPLDLGSLAHEQHHGRAGSARDRAHLRPDRPALRPARRHL